MLTRTWSKGRHIPNTANVLTKGTLPEAAIPAATPMMFCSAGPKSKNLSGNS